VSSVPIPIARSDLTRLPNDGFIYPMTNITWAKVPNNGYPAGKDGGNMTTEELAGYHAIMQSQCDSVSCGVKCELDAGHSGWHYRAATDGSGVEEWR
jgi:hypothetical protein